MWDPSDTSPLQNHPPENGVDQTSFTSDDDGQSPSTFGDDNQSSSSVGDDTQTPFTLRLVSVGDQFTNPTTSPIPTIADPHPTPTVDNGNHFPAVTMSINTDISNDPFQGQWPSWNARRRMLALRRWMLDMEWGWGILARWPALCEDNWAVVKSKEPRIVADWIAGESRKVATGRLMLGYLGRVMEGQLPSDIEEWRDLYLQGHQLTRDFNAGVILLEHKLCAIRAEYLGDRQQELLSRVEPGNS